MHCMNSPHSAPNARRSMGPRIREDDGVFEGPGIKPHKNYILEMTCKPH